jgi:hypothetical protein
MPRSIARSFRTMCTIVAAVVVAIAALVITRPTPADAQMTTGGVAQMPLRRCRALPNPASRPTPVYGGDAVPGETDDSYAARTGHHLPFRSSQPAVESNESMPVWGGDRASGESEVSFGARTGRFTLRSPSEVITLCPVSWPGRGPFGW